MEVESNSHHLSNSQGSRGRVLEFDRSNVISDLVAVEVPDEEIDDEDPYEQTMVRRRGETLTNSQNRLLKSHAKTVY